MARPNLTYEYKGYTPRYGWRMVRAKLEALDRENRIEWGKSGRPYLKRYLHEQRGTPITDMILDVKPLSAQAAERIGYPTQKPLALLDRIIKANSNAGDVGLDPFLWMRDGLYRRSRRAPRVGRHRYLHEGR